MLSSAAASVGQDESTVWVPPLVRKQIRAPLFPKEDGIATIPIKTMMGSI